MEIPLELVEVIRPDVCRDNAAASRYAFEQMKSFDPELPAHFRGPSELRVGSPKGRWLRHACYSEIARLKREFELGSHVPL